jgi:hypothetical protein
MDSRIALAEDMLFPLELAQRRVAQALFQCIRLCGLIGADMVVVTGTGIGVQRREHFFLPEASGAR